MGTTTLDPAADKVSVFNASTGTIDEAVLFEVVKSVLAAGANITVTPNPGAGLSLIHI